MVSMTMANKRTYIVFIRTRRNGHDALLREKYNLVQYGTEDGAGGVRGMTFIEGLPAQGLRVVRTSDIRDREVFDGIRIYDAPPFKTRIGSGMM